MYLTNQPQLNKLLSTLLTALILALTVFILAFTVKVGFNLVKVFQVLPVEAATDKQIVESTTPPALVTEPEVEVTPTLPTSTPEPEKTPAPPSTLPPTPVPDPAATPIVEETPLPVWAMDEERWIDVDLSEQRLTAYEGQSPVKSYLVSTGLPHTPTPIGQFRIWIKLRTDDMAGADYYIKDVPWVMYFFEGYGLHGVTWHANFGTRMSHGCVNQPNDMAEWLYYFADVGTLVNIHE